MNKLNRFEFPNLLYRPMRLYLIAVLLCIASIVLPHNIIASGTDYYIKLLQYGTDSDISSAFDRVYEDLGTEVGNEAIGMFFDYHSENVRMSLVRYLGMAQKTNDGLRGKTARLLARELTREGKTTDYSEALISAAGETGAGNSIGPMREMFEDEKTPQRTRLAIVDAFGKIGDKSVEELLIGLMRNDYEDKDIRARAILALGEMESTQSIDTMKMIVENTYEPKIMRMYAVLSLSRIGRESVLETLENALSDKDYDVATYAARGIADLECMECGPILMKALRSDYDRVRYYAIIGLVKLRFKESEEILKFKAEYDTNERVREEAKKALQSLTGDTEEKE
jgi:hypothetical protein